MGRKLNFDICIGLYRVGEPIFKGKAIGFGQGLVGEVSQQLSLDILCSKLHSAK